MVMLVPFTTTLPPQNDYSEYASIKPETSHEFQTDETKRLEAENQEDRSRKSDEEPDEEDFSKVLGILLKAAVPPEKSPLIKAEVARFATTIEATSSDLKATMAADALQSILSGDSRTVPSIQSNLKSSLPGQGSLSALTKSAATDIEAAVTQAAKAETIDTTTPRLPAITTTERKTEDQSEQILGGQAVLLNNTQAENFNSSAFDMITSPPQTNVEVLPNTQTDLHQFGSETIFLSDPRLYESAKDTDAVTQEIMNTLSRAVTASVPTRNPSGVDGLQSGVSSAALSTDNNLTPFGTENIGVVSSLGTSLSDSPEENLQQTGRLPTAALTNSKSEITDTFSMKQSGSDANRGSNQAASSDTDRSMSNPATATSPGTDGTRLSSPGSITLTLPDFATSVSSEMRQPLSSQVSRAVMEHLERRTTAESDTITVKLDPPDLGEMVIELSKSKEGLSVRVTAREAVTMDMLLARGNEIETQLRDEKMNLRSLEFLSPDMMNSGAFQGHTSQESTPRFDQPVGTQRRNSRSGTATQMATGTTTRTGDSQHALSFRA